MSTKVIEYFAARAKGGVGLIINGFTVVCPDELCGTAGAGQSHLTTLDNRNSFQLLAERLHEYDRKLFVQLHHPGRSVYAPQCLNGGRQLICDPEWANKAKAGREDGLVKSRLGDTTAKATYDGWYQSVYVPAVETAGTKG